MSQTPAWDVIVVGGANFDYLVRGPKLPTPGETIDGKEFHEGPGGKGANQAVAAARLGARVAMVARVGSDSRGKATVENLNADNVDTRFIQRDESTPTGVALIMVNEEGRKQIMTSPGANHRLTVADVDAAVSAIREARVLLTQLEVPLDVVMHALKIAKEAGVHTVLDPAPAVPLTKELLRLVDVIRPNAAEAGILTGNSVHDRASARRAAWFLLDHGAGAVTMDAGSGGNLLELREGEIWLPRIEVKTVDATGAGDAFAGALAVMLAEGHCIEEAGRFANAAAALSTTMLGAQAGLPRREAVVQLLERACHAHEYHASGK